MLLNLAHKQRQRVITSLCFYHHTNRFLIYCYNNHSPHITHSTYFNLVIGNVFTFFYYFRWKESTLTLPYEASKTAWPVSQLESYFLPEFPIAGTTLENKFSVVQEVAKGAFGKVYKVTEKETGQIYALKVLSKSKVHI